jgi:hypothetical protein
MRTLVDYEYATDQDGTVTYYSSFLQALKSEQLQIYQIDNYDTGEKKIVEWSKINNQWLITDKKEF